MKKALEILYIISLIIWLATLLAAICNKPLIMFVAFMIACLLSIVTACIEGKTS